METTSMYWLVWAPADGWAWSAANIAVPTTAGAQCCSEVGGAGRIVGWIVKWAVDGGSEGLLVD